MPTSSAAASPILMKQLPSDPAPLLFCPFCRECFEGERECPEHELALVPFEALPKEEDPEAPPAHDERLSPFDLRFGRGIVIAGIALSLIGFAMPVLEVASGGQSRAFSGLAAAASRAPNLWTIPFVAAMFGWILARRRTPLQMLGARLVGMVCSLTPMLALAYTWLKVEQGARQFTERSGQAMEITMLPGFWVIAFSSALLFVGSARLGVISGAARKAGRDVADRLRSR